MTPTKEVNLSIPDFTRSVQGLLPAIAQDSQTREVLMFAWMNEEAYRETLATGFATYYSRSRNKLWRKGEESGHRQKVTEIRVDCDADCILMLVEQIGAACHEGYASCFFRTVNRDSNGDETGGGTSVNQVRLVDPTQVYAPK